MINETELFCLVMLILLTLIIYFILYKYDGPVARREISPPLNPIFEIVLSGKEPFAPS
jgi:hypothetical protein